MQLLTVLVIALGFVASSHPCSDVDAVKEKLKAAWRMATRDDGNPTCTQCDRSVSAALEAYRDGVPPTVIREAVILFCKEFHLHTDTMCENNVNFNYPALLYMAQNIENVTANRVCSIVHQTDNCGTPDPNLDWSVDLGDDAEPDRKDGGPRGVEKSTRAGAPLNVLQLTDIHYDPNYLPGGNAECVEGFCCRSDQGPPATPSAAAGRWSDYRACDIPWEVITDTLRHVHEQHPQIDYVYMTGDLIDHAVWLTSREKNNETFVKVLGELKRSFGDIPLFPVIGNHEIHPFNLYAPVSVTQENVSSAWLYETLADLWSAWLPADTRATILKGGYYTVAVRPGFRVVVLNNNHCYTDNYWLVYNQTDPDDQLAWLAGVLRGAEQEGERVHLLYHVPSGGSDCNKRWSREFNRVINRFYKTVAAQFCGHTHNEEFHVFYSKEDPPRPINSVYVGGSLTPFIDVNGNYKMYSVDPDTMDILDHETWIFNLTAANLSPADTLPWERMYSFRDAYGVDSLTPADLDGVARRMARDPELAQQYYRFSNLLGDPMLAQGCDQECIEALLCGVVTTDSSDRSHCDQLLANRA